MIRILALILSLSLLFAQTESQTPPETVIRINVNLVQVDANVTDSHGKSVTGLKAEDFQILQDGKPQVITNFSYINIQPGPRLPRPHRSPRPKAVPPAPPPAATLKMDQVRRTIALVVDDLGLSFSSTAYVRGALKKLVDEQMQPGDLVAIVRTGAGIGALQPSPPISASSTPPSTA